MNTSNVSKEFKFFSNFEVAKVLYTSSAFHVRPASTLGSSRVLESQGTRFETYPMPFLFIVKYIIL